MRNKGRNQEKLGNSAHPQITGHCQLQLCSTGTRVQLLFATCFPEGPTISSSWKLMPLHAALAYDLLLWSLLECWWRKREVETGCHCRNALVLISNSYLFNPCWVSWASFPYLVVRYSPECKVSCIKIFVHESLDTKSR